VEGMWHASGTAWRVGGGRVGGGRVGVGMDPVGGGASLTSPAPRIRSSLRMLDMAAWMPHRQRLGSPFRQRGGETSLMLLEEQGRT